MEYCMSWSLLVLVAMTVDCRGEIKLNRFGLVEETFENSQTAVKGGERGGREAEGGPVGESKLSTSAWASIDPQYEMLVAPKHENTSVTLVIRGSLDTCLDLSFTYEPPEPSILPLPNLTVCPSVLQPPPLLHDRPHARPAHPVNPVPPHHFLFPPPLHTSLTYFHQRPPLAHPAINNIGQEGRGEEETNIISKGRTEAGIYANRRIEGRKTAAGDTQEGGGREGRGRGRAKGEHGGWTLEEEQPVVVNVSLPLVSRWVGNSLVLLQTEDPTVDVAEAFVQVTCIKSEALDTTAAVLGWSYTIIWDISFFPQMWLNWRRKRVDGLSLDTVVLNFVAFLFYALYNIGLFAIPLIKDQFEERYPHSLNHVRINDLVFAVYATLVEIIIAIQCLIYQRGPGQKVSLIGWLLTVGSLTVVAVTCVLAALQVVWWLDVFYLMSYLKLAITPLKYIPQVWENYKNKGTVGFSVFGIVLDFMGGSFSLAQMFILSANADDWMSIFTDFSKFGLGMITIIFDVTFFTQHYIYHLRGNVCGSKPQQKLKNGTEE